MNPNVVVSVSLLVMGACVGIFLWMNANGLTTDDISLSDACWQSMNTEPIGTDDSGEDILLCDAIDSQGLDWDTAFKCDNEENDYGYTFREMFNAIDEDLEDCQAQADLHGDTDEAVESGEISCGGAYKALVDAHCVSRDTRRTLTERLPGRELGDNTFWPGWAYGPCSMGIGFLMGGSDDAECSGLRGFNGGAPGCKKRYPRGRKYWLWDGCYNHDYCLVGNDMKTGTWCGAHCPTCEARGVYYGWSKRSSRGWNCDNGLAGQASSCAWDWEWKKCGWGCYYPSRKCDNSFVASVATWGIMGGVQPQGDWCSKNFP
jgi:hypothetical protein